MLSKKSVPGKNDGVTSGKKESRTEMEKKEIEG